MNTQFCRVGKIKPNGNKLISLKEFKQRIANFVEYVNKVDYSEDLNATA